MPVLINGELLPKELIREEAKRVAQAPDWLTVPDSPEKRMRLQKVADQYAIDRFPSMGQVPRRRYTGGTGIIGKGTKLNCVLLEIAQPQYFTSLGQTDASRSHARRCVVPRKA